MKKLTILLICCLTSMVITAAPVTAEQAKQAAIKFLNHKSSNRRAAKALNLQRPILNAVSLEERPMLYAFNVGDNEGFVLVSGSDLTDEIIGYSDHGTFDEEQMPDNMRSWLESYANAVRQLEESGKMLNKATTKKATKSYIAPLMTSQWDQSAPFNDMCPLLSDGTHCATGCTNTAFAQIMYYHKWPKEATKTVPGYDPSIKGSKSPAMPTLEPTTFKWDKIYPTYKNNEDGTEVARLMLYLGTASESDFGKETGATGYDALEGMKKYFDYDSGARTVWRSQYNYEEWVDILYAELTANRPVPFSGACPDNAHTFIIDGYDEEDYFHVNWGWGGLSDGYYKVSLLDPKDQGTGGSVNNYAYTMTQVAFIGVQPSKGQGTVEPNKLTIEKVQLYYDAKGNHNYTTIGKESSSPYYDGGYFLVPTVVTSNYNAKSGTFDLGGRLVKDDGTVTKDYEWMAVELGVSAYFPTPNTEYIYIDPKKDPILTNGDYKMYFISRQQPSKEWQLVNNWEQHYIKIHIDNTKGVMTANAISDYPELDILNIDFNTTPTANESTEVSFTLKNKGTAAYHGDIYIAETDVVSGGINCDVEPGTSIKLKMKYTPIKLGNGQFIIKERIDTLFIGNITVKESNLTDNVELTLNHQVTNATGSIDEGFWILSRKAKINVTVTNNTGKNYRGKIYTYTLYWDKNNKNIRSEGTENIVTVLAGETKVLQCESHELTGAYGYSFALEYVKNKKMISVNVEPNAMYFTTPTYLTYDAEGKVTEHLVTETIKTDATVCAVDIKGVTGIKDIYTDNPNVLYFVDEDSNIAGNNVVKGSHANNIILTDGFPFYCPYRITAQHISYTRIPEKYFDLNTKKGWTTLALPFAATGCQTTINGNTIPLKWAQENDMKNADIILLTYKYEDGNKQEFYYPEATLEMLHPYILAVPSKTKDGVSLYNLPITFYANSATVEYGNASITGSNYKMKGTFKTITDAKDIYTLNEEGSSFVLGINTVYPFRAYFTPISDKANDPELTIVPVPGIGEDDVTPDGIAEIEQTSTKDDKVYNLNGVRVNKPSKGIYIINGKKVIGF